MTRNGHYSIPAASGHISNHARLLRNRTLLDKPHDQVVIFDGGTTPFILRKVVSKDEDTEERWQLAGNCFLLGWMEGNYFGHAVVDQIPGFVKWLRLDDSKYLARESFILV